jgi:2-oxoglutarate ferredoxin oxidoreductase subunit alpha
MVPDMVKAGDGYRFHVTGLTHDERGYPSMNVETQDRLVRRLLDKLKPLANGRALCETDGLEDADVVVVSYGITSRVAQRALQMARQRGIRAGKFRLISAWPFPTERIRELAGRVKAFVVPELNLGQMVYEVERAAAGKAKVVSVPHAGGTVHNPNTILKAIVEAAQ